MKSKFWFAWAFAFGLSYANAQDSARDLLAKARSAFLENRDRARYWNWTKIEKRRILDRDGSVLEELPSVTIESPIRSDGRRCNAVLAWGDGREPYLGNEDADTRCKVETEVHQLFSIDALLASPNVKIGRRTGSEITLTIQPAPNDQVGDAETQCIASIRATVALDAATLFPKKTSVRAVGSGCDQQVAFVDHYEDDKALRARSSFRKGSVLETEYVLKPSKTGDPKRSYWAEARRHASNPLLNPGAIAYWGRSIKVTKKGSGHHIELDVETTSTELSVDSLLKFETDKKEN